MNITASLPRGAWQLIDTAHSGSCLCYYQSRNGPRMAGTGKSASYVQRTLDCIEDIRRWETVRVFIFGKVSLNKDSYWRCQDEVSKIFCTIWVKFLISDVMRLLSRCQRNNCLEWHWMDEIICNKTYKIIQIFIKAPHNVGSNDKTVENSTATHSENKTRNYRKLVKKKLKGKPNTHVPLIKNT